MKKKDKHIDVYELIAKNIKYYRKSRNMTQAELAEKTEYSHEFIRRIESKKGQKSFSVETIYRIAKALDVDISALCEEDKEKNK